MKNLKRAWIAWGLAALFVLYQFLLQASPGVMVPDLMNAFSVSIGQIGVLSSLFFYPYILLQIPSGILVDRFGPRKVMIVSLAIVALACVIFAEAKQVNLAVLMRLLMGIASAPAVVCTMCLAARWFPKEKFALLAGLAEMVGLFGGAVGDYCLSYGVTNLGWRHTLLLCAGVGALLVILALGLVFDQPKGSAPREPCRIRGGQFKHKLLAVIKIPQVWICCLFGGFLFSIISAFAGLWSIPFLQARYPLDPHLIAGASALLFVGAGFGAPLSGILAERISAYKPVMIAAAISSIILLSLVLYVALSYAVLMLTLFLLGLVSGTYVLPFAVVCKVTCEQIQATAMGFTNMICILIGALLQPLIGWMLGAQGSLGNESLAVVTYQYALLPLVVSLLLALICSLLVNEQTCREGEV